MAEVYARNRKVNTCVLNELRTHFPIGPDSKVLEVGSGTASHLLALIKATDCRGWGLEPSSEMRGHVLNHDSIEIIGGNSENLPFKDDFFDLLFSKDVIHHMNCHLDYFREVARVLKSNSMLCTVTDSAEIIKNRKPLTKYWPASADVDLMRFPTVESLLVQMTQIGFAALEVHEISESYLISDSRPYRDKAFSCLHLIPEEEFQIGLRTLESDLQKGPVRGLLEYICIWGKVP